MKSTKMWKDANSVDDMKNIRRNNASFDCFYPKFGKNFSQWTQLDLCWKKNRQNAHYGNDNSISKVNKSNSDKNYICNKLCSIFFKAGLFFLAFSIDYKWKAAPNLRGHYFELHVWFWALNWWRQPTTILKNMVRLMCMSKQLNKSAACFFFAITRTIRIYFVQTLTDACKAKLHAMKKNSFIWSRVDERTASTVWRPCPSIALSQQKKTFKLKITHSSPKYD